MPQDIPTNSPNQLPRWVEESLVKQLKTQFPQEAEDRIVNALKRSADSMQQTFNLAALLAAASAIIRDRETWHGTAR
ncbi:hypothetical protein OKA05_21560 [Luteolibacter arcticus]|uniref:Uncharacterized protein n=1 Tax=Luteolibacter arcticus TaxID=1581411 RepID=A0ABT3GNS7_9BACT|nr:hypothetical protein [Luteolibacter arcticus]MCW1925162.1 hypothetical protein [Luteolibacter arcticus]